MARAARGLPVPFALLAGLVLFFSSVNSANAQSAVAACTWNLRHLGQRPAKDLPLIAATIEEWCDVLVVQEAMVEPSAETAGVEGVLVALGDGWAGAFREHEGQAALRVNDREAAAFLYRRNLLAPCTDDAIIEFTTAPGFRRSPGFLCLEVRGADGAVIAAFVVGDYHARWERGARGVIAEELARMPAVIEQVQQAHPGVTIVVGADTNLPASARRRVQAREGWPSEIRVVEPGAGTTLRRPGVVTTHDYDVFIVDAGGEATIDAAPTARALAPGECGVSGDDYLRDVSDHLPVVVLLDVVAARSDAALPQGVECAGCRQERGARLGAPTPTATGPVDAPPAPDEPAAATVRSVGARERREAGRGRPSSSTRSSTTTPSP